MNDMTRRLNKLATKCLRDAKAWEKKRAAHARKVFRILLSDKPIKIDWNGKESP